MNSKIIVIPTDRKAYALTLKGETIDRKTLQGLVGGNIKTVPAMFEGTEIICTADGKSLRLPVNEHASNILRSDIQESIYGKAIWVQVKDIDFCGFTEERANKTLKILNGED